MYTFGELLEMKSKNLVFVNGDRILGKICVYNREDEWILFENLETQTQSVVYLINTEELYLCIEEKGENKPEIAITDKFEVYKQILN